MTTTKSLVKSLRDHGVATNPVKSLRDHGVGNRQTMETEKQKTDITKKNTAML